jgi:hypothetical protein
VNNSCHIEYHSFISLWCHVWCINQLPCPVHTSCTVTSLLVLSVPMPRGVLYFSCLTLCRVRQTRKVEEDANFYIAKDGIFFPLLCLTIPPLLTSMCCACIVTFASHIQHILYLDCDVIAGAEHVNVRWFSFVHKVLYLDSDVIAGAEHVNVQWLSFVHTGTLPGP